MAREVTSRNGRKSDTSLASRRDPDPSSTRLALSIPEFCVAIGISEDFFYKLKRQGHGPRLMKVGRRTLISLASADEWRREREREAATETAGA